MNAPQDLALPPPSNAGRARALLVALYPPTILALVGMLSMAVLFVLSEHAPGLPKAEHDRLVAAGRLAAASYSAILWYSDAILPGLAGVLTGLVALAWRTMHLAQLLATAVFFESLVYLTQAVECEPYGPCCDPYPPVAFYFGAVLFLAALLGAASLRDRRSRPT